MSASTKAVSFGKVVPLLLWVFTCAPGVVLAQSDINDVHVTLREKTAVAREPGYQASLALDHSVPLIRKSVDLVLVSVSVTDPMQRLVTGLSQENFQVFEGKKPQAIKHFSSEDAPVSVGVIVDTSGSMRDKMDRVREAVNKFCGAANPQDEFFIITFSDQPRLASDFTNAPEEIKKELVFAQPKGRTALLDAIYMGIGKMRDARYGKKALLIISDGGDNHSRYGEREVKAAVKESDVMIYAIGTFDHYASTPEELAGPELLSNVAETTGGRAFTLENPNDMPDVARRIGTELRTQYVLGYRPEDVPRDRKWHKISVKLRLPKKFYFLQVHAKKGYYRQGE